MDRMIVYPGAIPLDTDLLNAQRGALKGLGFLAQACLGSAPVVDGLACVPSIPASMTIVVGPGSMTITSEIDQNPYGSLPADSTNLVKMGIITSSTAFTLTAPTVSGQSINYLVEASYLELDAVPVVLPYYNAANPAQGFAGANNSGGSQNTQRLETVALQLKAGAAANTGTQATPAADPGCVAIAVITVNAGQTAINASSISVPGTAPFIQYKLPQLNFQSSPQKSGWQRLPSGVILQWGTGAMTTGDLDQFSFPLTFPNTAFTVCLNEAASGGWNNPSYPVPVPTIYGVNNVSASGFQASCISVIVNGSASSVRYTNAAGFNWMAIGF